MDPVVHWVTKEARKVMSCVDLSVLASVHQIMPCCEWAEPNAAERLQGR